MESNEWSGVSIATICRIVSHPFATVAQFHRYLWQGAWAASALGLDAESCVRSWLDARGARDLMERVLTTLSVGYPVSKPGPGAGSSTAGRQA